MIRRVISGGQTGVDIAALRAAKALGIPTGGTMPRGFKTLAGPRPEWAAEFGLTQAYSADYRPRTFANAAAADITIRIAVDFTTAGERCTMQAINAAGTPHRDIVVIDWGEGGMIVRGKSYRYSWDCDMHDAAIDAIAKVRAELGRDITINFAGNSERTAPGIEDVAQGIVRMILSGVPAA